VFVQQATLSFSATDGEPFVTMKTVRPLSCRAYESALRGPIDEPLLCLGPGLERLLVKPRLRDQLLQETQ